MKRTVVCFVLMMAMVFSIWGNSLAGTDLENDIAKAEKRKADGDPLEGEKWGVQSFSIGNSYVDGKTNTAVIEFTATLKQWYYNYGGELKTPLLHVYRDGTFIANFDNVPAEEEILQEKQDDGGNIAYIRKYEYRFTDTHEPREAFSHVYTVAFNGTSQFGSREYVITKKDVELSSTGETNDSGSESGTDDVVEIPVTVGGIDYANGIEAEDALFDGHIIKNLTGQGIRNADEDKLNYDQVVNEYYRDKDYEEIKRTVHRQEVNDEVATPLMLDGEVYIQKFGTGKRIQLTKENMNKATLRPGDKIFTGEDGTISFIPNKSGGLHTVGTKATFTFAGLTTFQKVKAKNEAEEWDEFKKTYLGFLDEGTIQCITSHKDLAKKSAKSVLKMFSKNKEDNYNVIAGSKSSFIMTTTHDSVNMKLVEGEVDMSILETNQKVTLDPGQEATAETGMTLSSPQSFDVEETLDDFAAKTSTGIVRDGMVQNVTVLEGGMYFAFQPKQDGNYLFQQQVIQKQGSEDNITSHLQPVHMEILDKEMNLMYDNTGSKGDVYKNSYNSGADVLIGMGQDPDQAKYYEGIKYDCFSGNTYYLRLDIPGEDKLSESDRELYGEDFRVSRDIVLEVMYSGEPMADSRPVPDGEEGGGGSLGTILLLLLVGIIIFFIIRSRAKKKKTLGQNMQNHKKPMPSQYNQQDLSYQVDAQENVNSQMKKPQQPETSYDTQKQDGGSSNIKCEKCGSEISPDAKFCSNCGGKNEPKKNNSPRFCINCSNELKPGTKFCPNCGNKV